MSDWGADHDRVASLNAGLNLEMPPSCTDDQIVYAARDGRIDPAQLDRMAQGMIDLTDKTRAAMSIDGYRFDVDAHDEVAHQAGGPALADVIFGEVSPSGKLAQSIPLDIKDDPSMINWPGEEGHVDYGEGVFVGYRYYDTYGKAVDYPFGYGLSYATFEITDVHAENTGANAASVTATVANTSDVEGAETVQVYVVPGKSDVARPVHELKGLRQGVPQAGRVEDRHHRPRRARVRLLVREVRRLARGGRRIRH